MRRNTGSSPNGPSGLATRTVCRLYTLTTAGVTRFAGGKLSSRKLLGKDVGGECFLEEPPGTRQFVDDAISNLRAEQDGAVALVVQLDVRRHDGCNSETEDPTQLPGETSRHVLRFVRRGTDLAADAATQALIGRYDWGTGS